MIRILLDRVFDNERHYIHAVGLSTDTKPTAGIITGSKFVAVDTGAGYLFDETDGEWNENQQLTEAVAEYLDEHPEALDEAAIEAMFGERLDEIEDEQGVLKSAISDLGDPPKLADSDATNVDLDISDNSGNVLVRFSEGHIKTKKFDSKFPPVKSSGSDAVADLDVADSSGNVIARFKGGNFETKKFTSAYIRQLTGKKWAAVGDSLTEVNSRTTMRYYDYIVNETGITVYNMGSSGTGYRRQQENNRAFYQRIQNVPADSDIVTIFGSFNDLGGGSYTLGTVSDSGTTTIGGCINTTIDNLYDVIPAVHLGIVTPTPWDNDAPGETDAEDYVQLIIDVCKRRSIPCLDLFHCSNLRPWDSSFLPVAYSKDDGNGVHPDETGHALIAPMFRQFLFSLI